MTTFPYSNDEILDTLESSPVAGGNTYNNDITQADADVVVSNGDELENALDSSADVIWCDADFINMGTKDLRPSHNGQTVAGDRGINGSEGPILYSNTHGSTPIYVDHDNFRITGCRLRGPEHDVYDHPEYPGFCPYPKLSNADSSRDAYYDYYASACITVRGDNCEFDNNEIYGWGNAGMYVGPASSGNSVSGTHIHHNYIHDCMKTSMGYGVEIFHGDPLIEYNYINATRHAIAGWGTALSSFTFVDNLVGPAHSAHAVDQHGVHNNVPSSDWSSNYSDSYWPGNAGSTMQVERNTFLVTGIIDDTDSQVNSRFQGPAYGSLDFEVFDRGRHTWDISIRGTPYPRNGDGIVIDKNSFCHDGPQPRNRGTRSFSYPYAYNQQLSGDGWSIPSSDINSRNFTTNYIEGDNLYDNQNKSYDPEYGAPVNFDGAVTGEFVVNAIEEGGEWQTDGIEGVEVTLTRLN